MCVVCTDLSTCHWHFNTEADLGMSVEQGPPRGLAHFCLGMMLTTLSVCVSCEFIRAVKALKLTVMSKKGHQVLEERKWAMTLQNWTMITMTKKVIISWEERKWRY